MATVTIYRVTEDTSEFFGLAKDQEAGDKIAMTAARRDPGVEFVQCDCDTGEWLSATIVIHGRAVS